MGIDWIRMTLREGVDPAEVKRLAEQQAVAFQGMQYYWSIDEVDYPDSTRQEEIRQFLEQYRTSSKALEELLIFPNDDAATGTLDNPTQIDTCWGVFPITRCTIFPSEWRREAHRTYLPDELREQTSRWRAWTTEVARGEHRAFLSELYVRTITKQMRFHYAQLKQLALASQSESAAWASNVELGIIREKIVNCPQPFELPTANDSDLLLVELPRYHAEDGRIETVWKQVEELIAMTRAWDRKVHGRWKLRYYQNYYKTFSEFVKQCDDEARRSFLAWSESCVAMGFGLYLDY